MQPPDLKSVLPGVAFAVGSVMIKALVLLTVLASTLALAQPADAPAPAPAVTDAAVAAPAVAPVGPRLLKDGKNRFTGTVPEGFTLMSTPRYELIGAGAGALAVGYLVEVLWTALGTHQAVAYVPFVGSLLGLPERLSSGQTDNVTLSVLTPVFDVLVSAAICAAQVAGIALVIIGVAKPHQWLEKPQASAVKVSLVPMSAGAPMGASLVATF